MISTKCIKIEIITMRLKKDIQVLIIKTIYISKPTSLLSPPLPGFHTEGGWNFNPQPHSPPEILKCSMMSVKLDMIMYSHNHLNSISEIGIYRSVPPSFPLSISAVLS